jgi:FAD binding domain
MDECSLLAMPVRLTSTFAVSLADSLTAHQLTPVGGHGLNSGIGDTYDLTWKLASVLRGYGGEYVLESYDHERRPVAKNNMKRVEEGMEFFLPMWTYATRVGHDLIHAESEAGERARKDLRDMIDKAVWIHSQEGTWVDYRYNHSPVVLSDPTGSEPPRIVTKYVPSSWPGSRAPHVYLADGNTSIFDLYGPDFNIVDFTPHGEASCLFLAVAKGMNIPIKRISLPRETHVRSVWQRDAVLIRPDGHIAWCSRADGVATLTVAEVRNVMAIATGRKCLPNFKINPELQEDMFTEVAPEERTQNENEMLADDKTGRIEQLDDDAWTENKEGFVPTNGTVRSSVPEVGETQGTPIVQMSGLKRQVGVGTE